jgi:hypothetical protein
MKKISLALIHIGFFLASFASVHAQNGAKDVVDLVIIVNAATKNDSMSETELSHALRGGSNFFELVGLQKQYYDRILKEMANTNSGDFDRQWFGLITTGKRRKKPFISDAPINLVALVAKNKNAIAVLDRQSLNKAPGEYGLKEVKIVRKKK